MSSLRKVAVAAALTITMVGMGLSPAKASTETWNFTSPLGDVGSNTHIYIGSAGDPLIATGLLGFCCITGSPVNLFGKNAGLDSSGSLETGLGVLSPPGGTDNEITAGVSYIRIQLPTGTTNVFASIASITGGEHAEIFGATSAGGPFVLVAGNIDASQQGALIPLQTGVGGGLACPTCTFFAFTAVGVQGGGSLDAANILLGSVVGTVVPLPGALPLFATGMGLIGFLASRRKRKLA